jgi:acyl phosphate:glycerol-3-phosphate acyltransferase
MPAFIQTALVFALSFLLGSLPFSVWLGCLFLHRDVRRYGDGNPGTMNVFRAGSPVLGILVLILDIIKGVLPPLIVLSMAEVTNLNLFISGVAPVLGHAFSPFLKFKGGKAIAVTFGIWIGLTTWQVPLVAVTTILIGKYLLDSEAWALMIALVSMMLAILFWWYSPLFVWILITQSCILVVKHRDSLSHPPHLHPRWHRGTV